MFDCCFLGNGSRQHHNRSRSPLKSRRIIPCKDQINFDSAWSGCMQSRIVHNQRFMRSLAGLFTIEAQREQKIRQSLFSSLINNFPQRIFCHSNHLFRLSFGCRMKRDNSNVPNPILYLRIVGTPLK
ncbi:hypothetical protein T4B_1362 [Trichinella pseudospiralis]|uniref:Uncharacterized protein n=1 Tax=Trichinella pseudospiralis TaxID=6337 RepID=A0A0V1IYK7_TRIPS|nr:hypothetical protein T4B_1362 [Trichinella pseudospiralis]